MALEQIVSGLLESELRAAEQAERPLSKPSGPLSALLSGSNPFAI
jgi:hypothetical protein